MELDQPKEQTVDEITKKDENISHENDNYDAKTEEEKCFQDETIRESESVEEHNDGLNEASKEKSVELKETPAATYGDEEKETISKDFSIDEVRKKYKVYIRFLLCFRFASCRTKINYTFAPYS